MTLENFNYRTNPLFLRNQFDCFSETKIKIPIIPKAEFSSNDFNDLLLLGFDRARAEDTVMTERMVHFFLYDYKFESVWKAPDKVIEKLQNYKAILSPDFSMYREMNPTQQLYNVFRNRWCGAYFASKGIKVIPTVSWGDENTFDFCFLGIPKGSTVAVSTYMVSEHGNHKDQKEFFLIVYNEMLKRIEPERIICYNTPFPEMKGNIVFVDYELSSWKYQSNNLKPTKHIKYTNRHLLLQEENDIIIKQGYVQSAFEEKGMGSAYGGEWQPKKEADKRFLGNPGETKTSILTNKREKYVAKTRIANDGRAKYEVHYTNHFSPANHTNPHMHNISWNKGFPFFEKPQPFISNEEKTKKEDVILMTHNIEFSQFESLSEFKRSLEFGGEIEFEWEGKGFGIFKYTKKNADSPEQIFIGPNVDTRRNYAEKYPEKYENTIDDILEYVIDGNKLRDIVTKIDVLWRNI